MLNFLFCRRVKLLGKFIFFNETYFLMIMVENNFIKKVLESFIAVGYNLFIKRGRLAVTSPSSIISEIEMVFHNIFLDAGGGWRRLDKL